MVSHQRALVSVSYHPFYLLQFFTFFTQIMFSLTPSDANDPQGSLHPYFDASLSTKQNFPVTICTFSERPRFQQPLNKIIS